MTIKSMVKIIEKKCEYVIINGVLYSDYESIPEEIREQSIVTEMRFNHEFYNDGCKKVIYVWTTK